MNQEIALAPPHKLWVRVLLMILLAAAFQLAASILLFVAVLQLVLAAATDGPNGRLKHFGRSLGRYLAQIADFESFGIRRSSVAAALRELENAGFIETTLKGRGGNADFRKASKYRLTFVTAKGQTAPTDEWRNAPTPPQDIDSRPENGSGAVGPKTGPKTLGPRPGNGSGIRPENGSGFTILPQPRSIT